MVGQPRVSILQNDIPGGVCAGELEQGVGDVQAISLVAPGHRQQPNPSRRLWSQVWVQRSGLLAKFVAPTRKVTPETPVSLGTRINVS